MSARHSPMARNIIIKRPTTTMCLSGCSLQLHLLLQVSSVLVLYEAPVNLRSRAPCRRAAANAAAAAAPAVASRRSHEGPAALARGSVPSAQAPSAEAALQPRRRRLAREPLVPLSKRRPLRSRCCCWRFPWIRVPRAMRQCSPLPLVAAPTATTAAPSRRSPGPAAAATTSRRRPNTSIRMLAELHFRYGFIMAINENKRNLGSTDAKVLARTYSTEQCFCMFV